MGFFNDLKEDLAAAVNELTETTAEKELADSEEKLREELAEFEKDDKPSKKKKKEKKKNASLEKEIQDILNGIDDSAIEDYSAETLTEEMLDSAENDEVNQNASEDSYYSDIDLHLNDDKNEEDANDISDNNNLEEISNNDSEDILEDNEDVLEDVSDESASENIDRIIDDDSFKEEIQDSMTDINHSDENIVDEEVFPSESYENVEKIVIQAPPVTVSIDNLQNVDTNIQNTKIITKGSKTAMEEQITIITNGTSIKGDIISDGAVEIYGSVTGSVDAKGKIVVSGEISGDSNASEIFVDGAKVHGNIESSGSVKVANESVIIGNIKASCAVIAGAVKGNIDVNGPVVLDSTAKVLGDIDCKLVQINNGAVIEGKCSQSYAEVSPSSFFENL